MKRNLCAEPSSSCEFLSWGGGGGSGAGDFDVGGVQGHSSCALVYAPSATPCDFYVDGCCSYVEGEDGEEVRWLGYGRRRDLGQAG